MFLAVTSYRCTAFQQKGRVRMCTGEAEVTCAQCRLRDRWGRLRRWDPGIWGQCTCRRRIHRFLCRCRSACCWPNTSGCLENTRRHFPSTWGHICTPCTRRFRALPTADGHSVTGSAPFLSEARTRASLTSAQQVPRAVAVEVVALAVQAAVPLVGILPLLALAGAAHALAVVAANVGAVVLAACAVHVLSRHVVAAAFALFAHAAFVTPDREEEPVGQRKPGTLE